MFGPFCSYAGILLLTVVLPACCTTVTCPEATLEMCVDDLELSNGYSFAGQDATLTGTTNESACPCDRLGFVQVGRITWISTGRHFQSHPEQQQRMTSDGWAVDSPPGAAKPWYPRVLEGPRSSTITLRDLPGALNWRGLRFEFVTCLICRDSTRDGCLHHVYCCVYWAFEIDYDGKIQNAKARPTTADERRGFDEAVDAWNDKAVQPGSGQQPLVPPLR